MASIGAVSCSFLRGYVRGNRQQVITWSVPGIDGVGRQRVGTSPSQSQLVAVLYADESTVEAWYRSIEVLAAAFDPVTATNDQGDTFSVLISDVSPLQISAASLEGGIRGECGIIVTGV